jgi:hypothetical protein
MFGAMWDAETSSPKPPIALMVCDQLNFNPSRDTPSTVAYTVPEDGRFHVTKYGDTRRLNSDIKQSGLDGFASANMRTLPMTFLHEMTHYDRINTAVDERTIDIASGFYNCLTLQLLHA